jgi:tRNA G46 methylase TrmB
MLKFIAPSLSFTSRKIATVRQRYPILPSMATQYTINDSVCPPLAEAELKKIVQKHCTSLDRFLKHKPIAKHTQSAFDQIYPYVDPNKQVILDSGCGTARSTRLLGEKFPNHTIIGIDRSFVRLNRNVSSKQGAIAIDISQEDDDDSDDSNESQRPFQAVSSNVLLVRAELTDFWRCCLSTECQWDITHHFILYPNPYPKKNRCKRRFYAHPSFPLILKIGGEITLRSNWEGYLKEFALSVECAHEFYSSSSCSSSSSATSEEGTMENFALPYLEDARAGPQERVDKSLAFTNFEKKYDDVGEKTYELKLRVHGTVT